MPPSLFRIQRLFLIAGYLVHMTAQGSRSAIKGLPSRKEWGEGTRTDGDVWKYIRPGSLYVRETEARDGLILSAGSSGKHRGEHNHDGDQRTTKATVRLSRATSWASSMGPRPGTSSP